MSSQTFDWKRFHSYRVFDEFLERFVINRKSYVTAHNEKLDFQSAFEDIRQRFIEEFDASDSKFEVKVRAQFDDATDQTKIVFANIEYLWAMPMANITPERKRTYVLRWFPEDKIVDDATRFFVHPHAIANPGPWYLRNKYWEIVAILRVLSNLTKKYSSATVLELKEAIAKYCYDALYHGASSVGLFAVKNFCGIHPALMHLAAPERYESIISDSHRSQILAVLGHVIANPLKDTEEKLKQIRAALYDSHGLSDNSDSKYRWFFYSNDIKPLWLGKNSVKKQRVSSAIFDVRAEEDAADLEGGKQEIKGYRIRRSAKLAQQAKERDRFTCRACDFRFGNQIVHVHHLDPLSEYLHPKATKLADLVTLCPTCHYLAHYWLREDHNKFKNLLPLLSKLKASTSPD